MAASRRWPFPRAAVWRRRGGYWGIALVVAIGASAASGAFVGSWRTARTYPAHVERNAVQQLVVNPSIDSAELRNEFARLDGVTSVHSDSLLFASAVETKPAPLAELLGHPEDVWTQVRGSTDGRYLEVDRPAVSRGRLPSGRREVFVSDDYRPVLEGMLGHPVRLGSILPVAFYWSATTDAGLDPQQIIRPIATEPLRVVGFGVLAEDALPDGLFPRQRMIVSADVAGRYDCSPDVDAASATGQLPDAYPRTCATQYRYSSLGLGPGVRVADVRRRLSALADRLNQRLPESLTSQGVGYEVLSQDRTDLDRAIEQTTRPTVISLLAFGVAAAIATVGVTVLAASRMLRRRRPDHLVWWSLGASRVMRLTWAAAPLSMAVGVGSLIAGAVAVLTAGLTPVGALRPFAAATGNRHVLVAVGVAFVFAVVLVAAVLLVSARHVLPVGRFDRAQARSGGAVRWLPANIHPSARRGASSALARGGLAFSVAGGLVFAAVVGAMIFAVTLTRVADSPSRFGWPWSVGIMLNGGYGDFARTGLTRHLDSDVRSAPGVSGVQFLALEPTSRVDGRAVTALFAYGSARTRLPVVSGRAAARPGEMVVGPTTFQRLHLRLGQRVRIESEVTDMSRATVVGTAVMPSLGRFQADHAGLGRGVFVVTRDEPLAATSNPGFAGLEVRPGEEVATVARSARRAVARRDPSGLSVVYQSPVRPPEVANIGAMRVGPIALAVTMALAVIVGMALALSVSVRDRQRELGLLRALGFTSRELRATVWWQVATTSAVVLMVGMPLGVVVGRLAWVAFADRVGLVPRPDLPAGWLALLCVGMAVAGAIAALPASRRAARSGTAERLRES